MSTHTFFLERFSTPIGDTTILTDHADCLRVLDWDAGIEGLRRVLRLRHAIDDATLVERPSPSSARLALEAYFAGDLLAIDRIQVNSGGTAFQRDVWTALRLIPVGQTLSYGALAAQLGRPAAVRAVGLANGANPTGIVVPCHRVIGADGSLTGYGGGIERKRWLLAHEGAGQKVLW